MLTASSTLAIFSMFGLSSLAVFWAKRLKLPHTVLLTLIGMVLGVLAHIPAFHFFSEFTLTPELLFYLLLPTLIFESAYNINIRRMVEESVVVSILSVISLLVSTVLIGVTLYYVLTLFGLTIPLIITLLFGALISATDPVAVLALFKEYGAPRRLSLIFEGESLFNDATSVAVFLIILEIARFGFHGTETILAGTLTFLSMMLGGILFGLLTGGIFATLVGLTRENEVASITITIVLAHTTFILSELLSDHLQFGTFDFAISPIIATTVASLLMGNYGRSKIHPRAEEFVENLWSELAFLSNSLIFILIGILFVSIPALSENMLLIIVTTVFVVALARAASVYGVLTVTNRFMAAPRRIPYAWQHLLSWGSLRGALAVTMVLLIPDDLQIAHWPLSLTPRDFLLSLTIGCIFATLFIKATTIKKLMSKLHLDVLTNIEEVEANEARALIHHEVQSRLARYEQRGYIDTTVAHTLTNVHGDIYNTLCQQIGTNHSADMLERVLRIFAIGIERKHLKDLYHHNEVNERVYRKLIGKLQLQLEAVEAGNLAPDTSLHTDQKDIFEHMAVWIRDTFRPLSDVEKINDRYMYYRAQTIIARKVLKELGFLDQQCAAHIFSDAALSNVTTLYTQFKEQSKKKMVATAEQAPEHYQALTAQLATQGVRRIEALTLDDLYERQLITPKVYITLKEELEKEM